MMASILYTYHVYCGQSTLFVSEVTSANYCKQEFGSVTHYIHVALTTCISFTWTLSFPCHFCAVPPQHMLPAMYPPPGMAGGHMHHGPGICSIFVHVTPSMLGSEVCHFH